MMKSKDESELLKTLLDEMNSENDLSSTSKETMLFDLGVSSPTEADKTVPSPEYTETRLSEDAVRSMSGWLDNEYLQSIENEQIIPQLDEILLLLIVIRGKSSGKELRQDLNRLFGADLSPGTVYPHLSDLANDGMLNTTKLARRKVYSISDTEAVLDRVEPSVSKLLTFSTILNLFIVECKSRETLSDGEKE